MQRTYTYEPTKYKVRIVFVGYLIIAFGVLMLVKWLMDPGLNLYIFGLVAAVYGTINTFVLKCSPSAITVDDETITFDAFGPHAYRLDNLEMFNLREFANAQFYLRIKTKDGKYQRYWVHYFYFSEKEDLIRELYHIEMLVHPDNLKFRGRKAMFTYRPGAEPEGWNIHSSL